MDGKADDVESRLHFFGNSISFDIFVAFEDHRRRIGSEDLLKESSMPNERLVSWVPTVLISVEKSEECGGYIWKMYVDALTCHASKVLYQPIKLVSRFVLIWEPEKLELPSQITKTYGK